MAFAINGHHLAIGSSDRPAIAKQIVQKTSPGKARLEYWQALERPDYEWTTLNVSYSDVTESSLTQCYSVPRTIDAGRDPSLQRFVGRPLHVMVSELEMRGPCFGPGVIFGNMRGGNSFWATPRFPDQYIEVLYRNTAAGRFVRYFRFHDEASR